MLIITAIWRKNKGKKKHHIDPVLIPAMQTVKQPYGSGRMQIELMEDMIQPMLKCLRRKNSLGKHRGSSKQKNGRRF